jgi:hypothetical protein
MQFLESADGTMMDNIVMDRFPEEGHVFFERIGSLCLEMILCPIARQDLVLNFLNAVLQLEPNHAVLAARVLAHLPEVYVVDAFHLIRIRLHDSSSSFKVIQRLSYV